MRNIALPPWLRTLLASDRLRHVAIAAVIAVVVAMSTLLRPVDIAIWSLQSKMFDIQPSGDIVLVEMEQSDEVGMIAEDNALMIRALQQLDAAGAERIFIDIPMRRSQSAETDAALRSALERLGDKVVLTRTFDDVSLAENLRGSDPFFERGLLVASDDIKTDFLGYVWEIDPHAGKAPYVPALWSLLSGAEHDTLIYPDYGLALPIPVKANQFLSADRVEATRSAFDGRQAILMSQDKSVRVPGQGLVQQTVVHFIAAETASQNRGQGFAWPFLFSILIMAIAAISCLRNRRKLRRNLYALTVVIIGAVCVISPYLGVRTETSYSFFALALFAIFRGISRFRRRHLYLDQRSRLPNFNALRREISVGTIANQTTIVVIKVARMDAVFAMLNQAEQARYLKQIAARLALGDETTTIYYDGGKYFALGLARSAHNDPTEHLEGLRAIVSQAIAVGQRNYDVSITIGADASFDGEVANRLNSAIAAADQAREAYRPVFVISDFATDSEEWDYSLQSRLETALSEDRISIKLQPQVDLQSGLVIGGEALARWVDEKHGAISPARFILQCERVGRLDDLTKRVLSKSLQAAEQLQQNRLTPRISVNVSAVQFVDSRIADLIAEQLDRSNADPTRLTIEVTETARIDDFTMARNVIEQIKRSGAHFSLDDFGIGSANFEALFKLPFDEVKIDQMFVNDIHRSTRARAVVGSIVTMANDAGIVSVAEGIEDARTLKTICDMGCTLGQGYFIAKPLEVPDFIKTLTLQQDDDKNRKFFS